MVLGFSLAGCTGSPRSSLSRDVPVGPGEVVLVEADWDDIFASVDAVAERHALGVLYQAQDDELATIELLDVLGRPIRIEARHVGADAELTVSVGRFGDPELERQIQGDLRKRLRQLHGVEFAPINWGR